jgi:K+-transporting ATPase ATPase C chain
MNTLIRPALTLFVLLTVLTGAVYPVLLTLIAQGVMPHQANGSIIVSEGKRVGSELIGQPFDAPKYFWGRPSATDKVAYNAESSQASNLGPTNPDFLDAVAKRIQEMRAAHPDQTGPVPSDLVTSSGSGLDPHISPASAEYQAARVAKARGLTVEEVRHLISTHTQPRTLGLLGEPRVNVLELNLALDGKKQ